MRTSIVCLTLLLGAASAGAGENPVELGKVRWLRDLDAGVKAANEADRPILLLFQEVPG